MLTKAAIDRLTGGLLLALGVALFVAVVTDIGVDPTRREFQDSLEHALEARSQYLTSKVFALASGVLWIAVASMLYAVFHSHDRTLALMGSSLLMVVGVSFLIHASAGFALADLAEEFAESRDAEAGAVFTSARAVAFIGTADIFGLFTVLPFGLLSLGALISWTKAVPAWLGWLALAVALLLLVTGGIWIGGFWDAFDMYVIWDYGIMGFLGVMLWLVLTGGWLLWRGSQEARAA